MFLCSELSYPLWALPSPLKLVQYPDRFLYVTTAVGLVANVVCVRQVWSQGYPRRVVLLVALPLVLSLLMTAGMYGKFTVFDGRSSGLRGDVVGPHRGLPEYLTRTVGPDWERYVQAGGLEAECASKHAQCREAGSTGRTRRWQIDTPQTTLLRLPVFAFPAWSLAQNGEPLASTIDQATGLIAIELPAGRSS